MKHPVLIRTSVTVAGIRLKNPVLAASGTFGYGTEYHHLCPASAFGAIVTKTITLKPRAGNPPPRLCETPSGMLNSIGLANVGLEDFLTRKLPRLKDIGTKVIVNIAGESLAEYTMLAHALDGVPGISGLEVNISCPNVSRGGLAFGADPEMAARVTRAVKRVYRGPLIIKLSPNVTDVSAVAQAVQRAGADAVSLINTLYGLAIDIERRRPVLGNISGGLSGPAIRPVALYHVYRTARSIDIPVIGLGGIVSAADAVAFMLAGAAAVQIGTANFIAPNSVGRINSGLISYCRRQGFKSVAEITGKLRCGLL